MKELEKSQALQLLRAMDRLRRAWKNTSPGQAMNKSEFFTLMTLKNKADQGFSGTQCATIDPFTPMTLSELAKAMRQTMPAVSQRIRKLEEQGYVQRKQDENDRRTVWIHLTQSGYDMLQQNCCIMFKRLERVLETIDKNGQQTAQQMIDSFNCLADAVRMEFERDETE